MKDHNWQVVSLELSRELKKAGFEQKGLWWWVESYWGDGTMLRYDLLPQKEAECISGSDAWVAPTVSELGETLPQFIKNDRDYMLTIVKDDKNHWWIGYSDYHAACNTKDFTTDTEANARAKMYLHLKKEGLL